MFNLLFKRQRNTKPLRLILGVENTTRPKKERRPANLVSSLRFLV